MSKVISKSRQGSLRERIKYYLRLLLAAKRKNELMKIILQSAALKEFFKIHSKNLHSPLSYFLDRRWGIGRRFDAFIYDLQTASELWGDLIWQKLTHNRNIVLAHLDDKFTISIGLNTLNPQEGNWALRIDDTKGQTLFSMSFGFVSPQSIFIASVQGVSSKKIDMRSSIKEVTKKCHGLRPHHLLIYAMQILREIWGLKQIQLINPKNHIKVRWNWRTNRIKFDYEALWTDAGGTECLNGNWIVPNNLRFKSFEDVPSNKRNQYRKRYEMLCLLSQVLTEFSWQDNSNTAVWYDDKMAA
jgi:uncharacterized protein VirK/YbjX